MKPENHHNNPSTLINFTYLGGRSEKSQSLEKSEEPYRHSFYVPLKPKRIAQTSAKQQLNRTLTQFSYDQTMKKQLWGVEARTMRKSHHRRVETQQSERFHLDESSINKNMQQSEINLLKEQIKYMRTKLMEAENAQKDLRLQFELYKANSEIYHIKQGKENQIQQIAFTQDKNIELQNLKKDHEKTTAQLQKVRLKLENGYIQRGQLQKKVEALTQESQILKTRNTLSQNEMQAKTQQILELRKSLEVSEQSLLQAIRERDQRSNSPPSPSPRNLSIEIEKMTLQKDRVQKMFEEEKEERLKVQSELKQKIASLNAMNLQRQNLLREIERKNNDINFLNHQSYTLDISFQNALKQVELLKQFLSKQEASQTEERRGIYGYQQKVEEYEKSVLIMEAEIQRLALNINSERAKYEDLLRKFTQDINIVNTYITKSDAFEDLKRQMENRQTDKDKKDSLSKSTMEVETARFKAQNMQLRAQIQKMTQNESILIGELQWLKNQKNASKMEIDRHNQEQKELLLSEINFIKRQKEMNHQRQEQQIRFLQQKLTQMTLKFNQLTEKYEQNLNSVIQSYQTSEKMVHPQEATSETYINEETNSIGQSLTQQEVNEYIQLLKNQPEIDEDNLKLQQDFDHLQEQMDFMKETYEQALEETRQKYQRQMKINKLRYDEHLSTYTNQIEQLMKEMAEIKGEYIQPSNSVEVIQEESEQYRDEDDEEYDDKKVQKVQRDLILHVEDPSDFYVSPPSNTPIKILEAPQQSDSNQPNYMLKDILDLESKVHQYIKNFNKKRSGEQV